MANLGALLSPGSHLATSHQTRWTRPPTAMTQLGGDTQDTLASLRNFTTPSAVDITFPKCSFAMSSSRLLWFAPGVVRSGSAVGAVVGRHQLTNRLRAEFRSEGNGFDHDVLRTSTTRGNRAVCER